MERANPLPPLHSVPNGMRQNLNARARGRSRKRPSALEPIKFSGGRLRSGRYGRSRRRHFQFQLRPRNWDYKR